MTEVAYLFANGVRLARLAYEPPGDVPSIGGETLHVFFELGDHLGSTSVVLDKATGELVERSTYQAYGGTESDYRPERWKSFRVDYRFTGKEEDVEVGLVYFGKRFLNPLLNRWISADPLAIHGLGADPNLYAYVSGRALQAVDPLGLDIWDYAVGIAKEAADQAKGAAKAFVEQQVANGKQSHADPVQYAKDQVYGNTVGVIEGQVKAAVKLMTDVSEFGDDFAEAALTPDITDEARGRKAYKPVKTAMSFAAAVMGAKDMASGLKGGAPKAGTKPKPKAAAVEAPAPKVVEPAPSLQGPAAPAARTPAVKAPKARLPQDIARSPKAPKRKAWRDRKVGKNKAQNKQVQLDAEEAHANGATDIRIDQEQVNGKGERVGRNRPDLQYESERAT